MRPSNWLPLRAEGHVTAADCDGHKIREQIQHAMTIGAGVVRTAESLATVQPVLLPPADRVDVCEARNLTTVAAGLVAAATAREETRGCHTRTDFPETSPALARRFVLT